MAFLTNLLALATLLNKILTLLDAAYQGGAAAWLAAQHAKADELASAVRNAKTTEDRYAIASKVTTFFGS